jgi:precorrin-6Y C5,15-methyltransferase (decarboxylating)
MIVVGIGADGWDGLPDRLREVVSTAPLVVGARRQLELLPEIPGQRRELWPSPLRSELPAFLASLGVKQQVVALASGDPFVSGIGTTLTELLGRDQVQVYPGVSSIALARAEMGWSAESCAVVSLVGRPVDLLRRELAPGRRILALSSDEDTPHQVAELLDETGYGASALAVLADLGGPDHTGQFFDHASDITATVLRRRFPRLNIVAISCVGEPIGGWVAGLPDDCFEHDGQLTKRDLRASALARLAPVPGEHLWDVGAGAGSVGIEWMRAHPTCTTTAIESSPERAARIARNAARLGVPGLVVVEGRAPAALADLPAPHAVFVGGGATREGVVDTCLSALRPGGRLVVHGVTLETETLLARLHREHGGELTRISVETTAPVGTFTGWTPARTVTQWALTVSA